MQFLLLFVTACLAVDASDDDQFVVSALQPANGIVWRTMSVTVRDSDGNPIEGASIRPWAVRAGNGHGAWNENTVGAPRVTFTAANGEASIVYPKDYRWGARESNPVSQVSVVVKHAGFVARNVHLNVPAADAGRVPDLTLNKGVRLRVAGVEPGTGKPLDHCFLVIENAETGEEEYVREQDGWLQSYPISESRRWFRVIHAAPGMPPRFSKAVAWTPEDPASQTQRVELRPGARVVGRVSDNVARPIERGHVVAWCGSPVRNEEGENAGRTRPIFWIDTVPINEDGTFVFPSLPSGYLVQFFAIANDFISAQPSEEDFQTCCKWFARAEKQNDFFRHGQILRLAGTKSEITIEMEEGGQVRVKCVDPDGMPLPRVTVSSWPNQYIVGAGSNVFCNRQSSLEYLQGRPVDYERVNPFSVKTAEDGIAVIRHLPAGNQSIVAGNLRWTSEQNISVKSDPSVPAELTLTLQPRQ